MNLFKHFDRFSFSDHSFRTILTDIYEKIENEAVDSTNTSTHFINTKLQDVCPKCASLHQSNPKKNILMKTLSVYEKARLSKKACLSFTTKHSGKIIQISLLVPCPQCCQKSWVFYFQNIAKSSSSGQSIKIHFYVLRKSNCFNSYNTAFIKSSWWSATCLRNAL